MGIYNFLFQTNKQKGLYGNASYMKQRMLRRLFQRKAKGISLDTKLHLKSEYTCLGTLIVANPGAGKSTLLKGTILQKTKKYRHSFWTVDPANDIYNTCHKWLESQGYIIKVINLDDASKSLKINPLLIASKLVNGIEDLATLLFLVQYQGTNISDPFWKDSGQNLLILLMRSVVSNTQKEFAKTLETVYMLLTWFHVKQEQLDRFVLQHLGKDTRSIDEYKSIVAFSDSEDKMLHSIVNTAKSALAKIVNNKTLCEITSDDNFELETLRKVPQAIFIQVREDRIATVKPILSILNKLLLAHCMELPKAGEEYLEVHAYIDEAGSYFIQGLEDYIVVMRKRKISIMLFLQDLYQLNIYGAIGANVIKNNCLNKLIFGAVSNETATWASSLIGKDTKEVLERPVGVPLISPQEIRDLQKNQVLFIHKHKGTILKIRPWYKQWRLRKRAGLQTKKTKSVWVL